MIQHGQSLVFRLIVVYRREPREIPDAEEAWRGWIQTVSTDAENSTDSSRLYFEALEDLPGHIRQLMK